MKQKCSKFAHLRQAHLQIVKRAYIITFFTILDSDWKDEGVWKSHGFVIRDWALRKILLNLDLLSHLQGELLSFHAPL